MKIIEQQKKQINQEIIYFIIIINFIYVYIHIYAKLLLLLNIIE